MNIGLVTVWMERGAAYVTKYYADLLLKKGHNVYIYARGGEIYEKRNKPWIEYNVTYGYRMGMTRISWRHLKKWICKNKIEVVFFNEQRELKVILKLKKHFPNIKVGTYVDYYKEDTINEFELYDFLICNTLRHYEVFTNHPQAFYVKWGTDIEMFKPQKDSNISNKITFFHSAGMSDRKGTILLINTFIKYKLYKEACLIIHSQKDLNINEDNIKKFNINIIKKTVGAPGLYHLGDVYVYPTYLEGLGLTIYEALACGLPVITTDYAPMNEIITNEIGRLVKVKKIYTRSDAYYWPITICDENDLAEAMLFYIQNKNKLQEFKNKARYYAIKELNIWDRIDEIDEIFNNSIIFAQNKEKIRKLKYDFYKKRINNIFNNLLDILPDGLIILFYKTIGKYI